MKKQIRVIGFDDGPHDKFSQRYALVVGTIYRGGSLLEGVVSTKVTIDGNNATEKLIEAIRKSRFRSQLQVIFLDGIAFGGFNVIDINEVYKKTKLPVIVVIRKKPNFSKIKQTLTKLDKKQKIKLIDKAGPVTKIRSIYVQYAGIERQKVQVLLNIVCTNSNIPEPVRMAHIIAAGIVEGESKGNA